jgi:hypothetical protein
MDSRPGLYESVLVLDYKSLYPSIIRTFLIDPVGLIEGLREPDDAHSVAGFRGARFSRTRHALPAMVERVWQGREAAKRAGNAALSQALKLSMNSCYGVLGSSGCRFFVVDSSIVTTGDGGADQVLGAIDDEADGGGDAASPGAGAGGGGDGGGGRGTERGVIVDTGTGAVSATWLFRELINWLNCGSASATRSHTLASTFCGNTLARSWSSNIRAGGESAGTAGALRPPPPAATRRAGSASGEVEFAFASSRMWTTMGSP